MRAVRERVQGLTPEALYEELVQQFKRRKFSAGLLVALIDLITELGVPTSDEVSSYEEFLAAFPRKERLRDGRKANTLTLESQDGEVGLRGLYNEAERYFRAGEKRFDYPTCAPHATQAWPDYIPWLDALCGFTADEVAGLRRRVCSFVLDSLPSHEFDPTTVEVEPPQFSSIIESFDLTCHKREKSGAAYQGLVFGFLRADNPHLQVEIDKVRTGSKRLQRVGDIDAWEGQRLAVSAEVKQFVLSAEKLPDLQGFASEVGRRGAIGIVAALEFAEKVRPSLQEMGLETLDLENMRDIVSLWDPMKQRTAVSSMLYYASHVEKNASLLGRLTSFLKQERSG